MGADDYIQASTTQNASNAKNAYTRQHIVEIILKKFQHLPETDRNFFSYSPIFLGINGAFAGLIANSLFRRLLNVSQGFITSSLPMAALPFITTVAAYTGVVSDALLSGDLNCQICAVVRGGLVGSVAGGLYPILLALPVNAGLAARYSTALLPEKGNRLRFFITISQPVLKKMSYVLILQAVFGIYLSSRQYNIYMKMLQLPEHGVDVEEMND
ncbi:transmembrane protein 126A [Protopterus annectens]|uniref:transmembrane protein 126A n=1 Tax=Protopterus annectens TaxID=7888 RepID=UPI001CF9A2B2|nr:transmembrane protein 126A [Protopterus annectens]